MAPGRSSSLFYLPICTIALAALSTVLPFLWLGIPSGHDFEFHFNSWLEVVQHWKQGFAYPHWSALAHYGYGEARFIFYPPFSWLLGAMVGVILPWKIVSGAYIWLALTLCGVSMFFLARRWLPASQAVMASVSYLANPYHLVIVYWRSDFAELLASAYLPLLLAFVLRWDEDHRTMVAPLSLLLAAAWLTNIPSAIMINYSLALLVVMIAFSTKNWKVIGYAAAAVILGAAIAGIYLVPVFHQRAWVSIGQVLAAGVRPVDNFLFTTTGDPDHNRFNRLTSLVAVWEIALVAVLLFLSRGSRNQTLWGLSVGWAVMGSLLMLRFTLPLWTYLPELRYVQFPWRWLLCLNVVLPLGIVMAFRRWWSGALVFLLACASVAFVWHRVLPPWWDTVGDIQEMVDNQQDGIGNEGVDEYVPAGADPYEIDQNSPPVRLEGPGTAEIRVENWQAEHRVIQANASSSGKLVLRLFNYPLWRVKVNGRTVPSETTPQSGQMLVPIAAGMNRVQITFVEGWDRPVGAAISILGLLLTFLVKRRMDERLQAAKTGAARSGNRPANPTDQPRVART
jgi:6-pyruvoyl-tetrahydropterin synthase related domain